MQVLHYHRKGAQLNTLERFHIHTESAASNYLKEALVAATKETGLEVNAHKTKYMTVSRDQNAGRIHIVRIDNSSIERVEEFKYLGTTLTNQNSIHEEIKSKLKSGNACYYSVQNVLSSRLLSKNSKIKICFFNPMPHMSLTDFVIFPPGHGRSVTDFSGWDAHEARLLCPDYVSGDIGGCSARRVLKPNFY